MGKGAGREVVILSISQSDRQVTCLLVAVRIVAKFGRDRQAIWLIAARMGGVVERVRCIHGGLAEEGVTLERLDADRPSLGDLAEECRSDAWAFTERALDAAIEEAIVVVANGLRARRF